MVCLELFCMVLFIFWCKSLVFMVVGVFVVCVFMMSVTIEWLWLV